MADWCLALHQRYRCAHSGVCCSTDWLVPAQLHVLHVVEQLGIRPGQLNFLVGAPDEEPWVAREPDGACVFFDREAGRLCRIHRDAGEQALPAACRHFPRQILQDARGTFISLSHYCPTAAGLLAIPNGIEVVEAKPPLRLDGPLEPLDAREALPPLLRPGLLMDLVGYDAWERACLAVLARRDTSSERALRLIAGATEALRDWKPETGPLAEAVTRAFAGSPESESVAEDLYSRVVARHSPAPPHRDRQRVWERLVAPALAPLDYVVKNYLAARLFGNWIAYQGRGLRSVVAWLFTCNAVLRNEIARSCVQSGAPVTCDRISAAAGAADLLLLHKVDCSRLAQDLATVENCVLSAMGDRRSAM